MSELRERPSTLGELIKQKLGDKLGGVDKKED